MNIQAEGINNRIWDQVYTDERGTVVWLYLALQDAASLLDGAQLRGGGWNWRILLARRVPLHWALCCSHGERPQKWTFIFPVKTDGTAFLGDVFSVLNIQYPEGPDMKLDSAAPPRGGLDQEWWGARTSKLFFRTVWTTSPHSSHGARLTASQVVLVERSPGARWMLCYKRIMEHNHWHEYFNWKDLFEQDCLVFFCRKKCSFAYVTFGARTYPLLILLLYIVSFSHGMCFTMKKA